ncbi:MAG: hypothetical protein FWG29_01680 [Treponema sp.]|nr:hypothetical protein [Treponema sp.]
MLIDPAFTAYYPHASQPIGIPKQTVNPAVTGMPGISRLPEITGTPAGKQGPQQSSLYFPAVVVDISPEAWDAYNRNIANKGLAQPENPGQKGALPGTPQVIMQGNNAKGVSEVFETHECQTCKSRKYQDSSSDPSVSFQAPTHLSPGQAAGAVAAHEGEHVSHEQAKAEREDRQIVSQTVTINTAICPECGRVYVSGGVTRTITANKQDNTPEVPAPAETPAV